MYEHATHYSLLLLRTNLLDVVRARYSLLLLRANLLDVVRARYSLLLLRTNLLDVVREVLGLERIGQGELALALVDEAQVAAVVVVALELGDVTALPQG